MTWNQIMGDAVSSVSQLISTFQISSISRNPDFTCHIQTSLTRVKLKRIENFWATPFYQLDQIRLTHPNNSKKTHEPYPVIHLLTITRYIFISATLHVFTAHITTNILQDLAYLEQKWMNLPASIVLSNPTVIDILTTWLQQQQKKTSKLVNRN